MVRDEQWHRVRPQCPSNRPHLLVVLVVEARQPCDPTDRDGLAVREVANRVEHAPLVGRHSQRDGDVVEVVLLAREVVVETVEQRMVTLGVCGDVVGERDVDDLPAGDTELDRTAQRVEVTSVDSGVLHVPDEGRPALES